MPWVDPVSNRRTLIKVLLRPENVPESTNINTIRNSLFAPSTLSNSSGFPFSFSKVPSSRSLSSFKLFGKGCSFFLIRCLHASVLFIPTFEPPRLLRFLLLQGVTWVLILTVGKYGWATLKCSSVTADVCTAKTLGKTGSGRRISSHASTDTGSGSGTGCSTILSTSHQCAVCAWKSASACSSVKPPSDTLSNKVSG